MRADNFAPGAWKIIGMTLDGNILWGCVCMTNTISKSCFKVKSFARIKIYICY
jgi:hypothetical protein